MFRIKFLRNVLFASLSVALILPLYDIFIVYPSFIHTLVAETKNEAVRTAKHLASQLFGENPVFARDTLPIQSDIIETLRKDFELIKIKIFSPSGEIIYSTDSNDIGKINKNKYFHEVVAKGNVYAKIVQRDTRSLEGYLMERDNVETYVPVMSGNRFLGAFEIYYDFTARKERFEKLVYRAFGLLILLSGSFIAMLFVVSSRAGKIYESHKEDQEHILQSEKDWKETFDALPDMITVHDKEFNIVKANKAAREILGLPLQEITKAKCYRHYHGKDSSPEGCPSCDCFRTEKPATFEVFEPHLNKYIEIKATPRFDADGKLTGLIHVVRDITERKQVEGNIQLHLKRLNVLRLIDRAITSSLDLQVTLDIFLDQVTTQLEVDAANILLLNQHTLILEHVSGRGFRSHALKYTKLKLGESNAGKAATERRIVSISNLKEDPDGFVRSRQFTDEDFVTYFAVPLIAKGMVKGVLELFHRTPLVADREWLEFIETVADQAAIAIDNAALFEGLQRSNVELKLAYDTTIEGWSRAMDLRDKETEGHTQRVTEMTIRITREFGMKEEEIVHIRRGALLHDIGKMGVPDGILLKPGPLTDDEWKIMKRHPVYAYDMLYPIKYLRSAIDIPYCHHEKWDGTGYPRGLKGENIPLSARIFAVVDIWDALCSDRPYRPAWPKEKVIEHIRSLTDTHLDPEVVMVFLKIIS